MKVDHIIIFGDIIPNYYDVLKQTIDQASEIYKDAKISVITSESDEVDKLVGGSLYRIGSLSGSFNEEIAFKFSRAYPGNNLYIKNGLIAIEEYEPGFKYEVSGKESSHEFSGDAIFRFDADSPEPEQPEIYQRMTEAICQQPYHSYYKNTNVRSAAKKEIKSRIEEETKNGYFFADYNVD